MPECVSPEGFGHVRADQRTSDVFTYDPVEPFRHTIQFRRVGRSGFLGDTMTDEVGQELCGDILSAIFRPQLEDLAVRLTLKDRTEKFEKVECLIF